MACVHQILGVIGKCREAFSSFVGSSSVLGSQLNQEESHSIINKWFHGNRVKTLQRKGTKELSGNICLCFRGCLVSR